MGEINWDDIEDELGELIKNSNKYKLDDLLNEIKKIVESKHPECDVAECCREYASEHRASMYDPYN